MTEPRSPEPGSSERKRIGASDVEKLATKSATESERKAILARAAADPDVNAKLAEDLREREAEHKAFTVDARRRSFASLVEEAGASETSASARRAAATSATTSASTTQRARPWAWLFGGLGATAAAGTLVLVMFTGNAGTGRETPDASSHAHASSGGTSASGVLVRGGLTLKVAVLSDGVARELTSGATLRAHDRVKLTVDDAQGGYYTVLLEDAAGIVEVLYEPAELGRLSSGRHELPDSIELDDAVGRERLWVLLSTASAPPDVDKWREAIELRAARVGFDHGWLPDGDTRVAVVEWTKAPSR